MPTPTATIFLPYHAFDASGAAWDGFDTIYAETPWTPALSGMGGASGQTYATQMGWATRIGRLVVVAFDVGLTAKGTITGDLIVTGLPAVLAPAIGGGGMLRYANLASNWSGIGAGIAVGLTTITVSGNAGPASSDNVTPLTGTDLTNTTAFRGLLLYHV